MTESDEQAAREYCNSKYPVYLEDPGPKALCVTDFKAGSTHGRQEERKRILELLRSDEFYDSLDDWKSSADWLEEKLK